jgi:hypothetical protein
MRELWDQILVLRDARRLGTPAVRTFPFEDAEGALQAIAARGGDRDPGIPGDVL